jgi:hypothetical protein
VGAKIGTDSVAAMGEPIFAAEAIEGAAAREPRMKKENFIV